MSGMADRGSAGAATDLPSQLRDIFLDQLANKLRSQYQLDVRLTPATHRFPPALCVVNPARPEDLVEFVGCSFTAPSGWRFVWQGQEDGHGEGAVIGPAADVRGAARIVAVAVGRRD